MPHLTPTAEDLLAHALKLLRAGISIIPVETTGERAKRPHYQALVGTGYSGKRYSQRARREVNVPTWEIFQTQRATEDDVRAWILQYGARGVAMVTGEISGLIALDFDPEGMPALEALGLEAHTLSPSGGAHVFVRWPGHKVKTLTGSAVKDSALPAGLDIRGDGGYIILPPTVMPKGAYRRTDTRRALKADDLPEDFAQACGLLSPAPVTAHERPQQVTPSRQVSGKEASLSAILERAVDVAYRTGRNNGGFYLACQLRDNGYTVSEARSLFSDYAGLLSPANAHGEREDYNEDEYAASVRSAYSKPPRENWRPSSAA